LQTFAVRAKVGLRQGLWIEDLRTPPGQECSNGSLILLAVVLWRTFPFELRETAKQCERRLVRMKLLKVKTVRFADVVDQAGKPAPYTLWQKPGADRHFQSALKNNRVMTIQQTATGTEFGFVGFKQSKTGTYLLFPKSLMRHAEKRIVGIKWDLVQ
jgi:hypothetical protein